jgi:hypothetical protein
MSGISSIKVSMSLIWTTVQKNEKRAMGQAMERLENAGITKMCWDKNEIVFEQSETGSGLRSGLRFFVKIPVDVWIYDIEDPEEAIGHALERLETFLAKNKAVIPEESIRVDSFSTPSSIWI